MSCDPRMIIIYQENLFKPRLICHFYIYVSCYEFKNLNVYMATTTATHRKNFGLDHLP